METRQYISENDDLKNKIDTLFPQNRLQKFIKYICNSITDIKCEFLYYFNTDETTPFINDKTNIITKILTKFIMAIIIIIGLKYICDISLAGNLVNLKITYNYLIIILIFSLTRIFFPIIFIASIMCIFCDIIVYIGIGCINVWTYIINSEFVMILTKPLPL